MDILILDGYNVIYAVPEFRRALDRSLEASRRVLLHHCRVFAVRRSFIKSIWVVFDGDERKAPGGASSSGNVREIYTTSMEEADQRIIRLVHDDRGRSRLVIVSNDTFVFNNARALGAGMMSVKEFMDFSTLRPSGRAKPQGGRGEEDGKPSIGRRRAREITEEYRRHLEERLDSGEGNG